MTITDTKKESAEKFNLAVSNGPSLKFTGWLIGEASSSDNNASSDFSGTPGRWTELELYETTGGKYICRELGKSRWEGEHTKISAKICDNLDQVKEFFGYRWLAKDLYKDANIDYSVEIE